jgi:hypothetical protein
MLTTSGELQFRQEIQSRAQRHYKIEPDTPFNRETLNYVSANNYLKVTEQNNISKPNLNKPAFSQKFKKVFNK